MYKEVKQKKSGDMRVTALFLLDFFLALTQPVLIGSLFPGSADSVELVL